MTLTLRTGEKVGLVGVNGSGKSTLARVLVGIEPSEGGTIAKKRGAEVAYLPQEPVFDSGETARSAVLSGLSAWSRARERYDRLSAEIAGASGPRVDELVAEQSEAAAEIERLGGWDRMHQVEAVLGHLGVSATDTPVRSLSGGEQRRVALARLLIARPDLAVLDEPTNHLDVQAIEWLESHLVSEFAGAILLITHDRYLLDRVVGRVIELDHGKVYSYDGGYEDFLLSKAERAEQSERVESNRRNFLRRELEWLARQPKARSTKQKARIERAETANAVAAPQRERSAVLTLEETRSGKSILDFTGVDISIGDRKLVSGLDWSLTKGERVGILGRNGTGKTTLLRAVVGELAPSAGTIAVGKNAKVAYFDQMRTSLDLEVSVFDTIVKDHPRIEINGQVITPYSYLERFLFDSAQQRQPVGSLSGGERARVALAKMLCESANLIILDEPTNDLDVATLGALEQMLIEFSGTALVVTHDRWFLDRVATSILAFEGAGKVTRYAGNYGTYVRLRSEAEAARRERPRDAVPSPGVQPSSAPSAAKAEARKSKGLTFAEKKELESMVERIEAADGEVSALEKKLQDPDFYAKSGPEVKATCEALEKARADAAALMQRWEELELRRSGS